MDDQKILLTEDGLEALKKELDDLVSVKRPKAVARLAAAKAEGDLSENSEYSASIEELSFIDGRIDELEGIVRQAKTVVVDGKKKSVVDVGCKVTVHVNKSKHVFHIVGEWEADPREKKISHSSPLGKALVGRRKGDKVEVDAPAGKVMYTIMDIS